ncbi:SDR family NAD(P)-dependent oxidoreductase [Mycoavidus sp. SF9855]|uniref:SDR family NAD(P)-dependent oxidoreductase n=1 Tax=Mycoavidus sp. SF9855 TaxID=2968475 RepID=UPI00211CB6D6|nr:SDR family NAD(P)-dependent oxidoreductase [Mycoavidus sp. SF9855]UUM22231.1 SDR family NAD(P)-dependent oxidoreductase [Mycoavidus sp. SF9855]
MLDVINGLANGWVASHVIGSFVRHGVWQAMSARPMRLKKLASRYRGNVGHLHAGLRLLYELGWVEWVEADRYGVVAGACLARQLPSDLEELAQLPLVQALAVEQSEQSEYLLRWLDRCNASWPGVEPMVASLLDGALLTPLLAHLHTLGSDVLAQTQPSDISVAALHAVQTVFIQRGWGQVEAANFQLTPSGRALLANSGVLGTVVSYTPMLRHLDDLLFGEAQDIFGQDEPRHELHLDRTLNIIASGVQHQSHFAELDTLILRIFDHPPLATQPRYIADMGCGDGSLLLRIYQLIKTRSARGQALAEYPLTLIGADDNALSLEATGKTLAGLPHLLVRGSIADPQQLITDLAAAGIEDPENILHVRAFLDHECPFLSIEDKRAARRREGLNYTGVYIARDGSEIKPAHAVQGLVEHLRRWRMAVSRFGLLSLEVHCLRPNTVKCLGNMTESAHFDAFKAFSGQQLVEASVFLMAAAEVGLFPEPGLSRTFPERLNFTRLSLHRLIPQSYTIRHPVRADLSRLKHLNRMCEPSAMRISTAEIKRRVCDVPQQQMVLEFAGQIAAVLYTQRIDSVAALRSICYAEVGCLCQAEGRYVQLLGLFVAPEMHGRGFSDALLDLMLVYGSLLDGVEAIVGVTRCAHYSQYQAECSLDQYIELRDEQGQLIDPMLHFHASHGAVIREVLPGFRPGDTENEGAGVLIEYRLRSEQKTVVETAGPQAVSTDTTRAVNQVEPIVRSAVIEVLGSQRAPAYDPQAPLMEMGLSSLELLELRRRLSTRLGESLPSTFFFSYGTPEAIIGYFMAQVAVQPVAQTTVTPAPQASIVPARVTHASASHGSGQESSRQDQVVAIIGVACRLPDRVNTPAQFWQELLAARDGVGALPAHRQVLWGSQAEPCRWQAGFLTEVECFDAGFFRISPREAKLLDPQQRLLLEVAWEALESAAIAPAMLRGTRSGVFVGMMGSDYEDVITRNGSKADINAHFATGNACSVAAGRLSYFFDWQGPALSIDTACSSSLVAVHTACRSLLGGECTLALAAGVNLLLDDKRFLAYEQAGMLSPHGRCRTFDASADGYVRGEGCAAVVLKRLSDAQADEDPIMAVIRGSAINQDGSSSGLTAPNQLAQQAVIEAALVQAGLAPHEIGYLEAHGTGTKLGDPIEIMAAAQVLGAGRSANQPLLIGSLKSVMGHLEAAAGIAGLIKTVLSMQHGVIPAQLHFATPNPYIPWERLPVQVVAQTQRWPAGLKRAGVSSFGFSGTNAHVIVEEYISPQKTSTMLSGPVIIVLSAKSQARLRQQAQQLQTYLKCQAEVNLADLAYTLQVGREALDVRLALVVRSINELKEQLLGYAQGKASQENIYQGEFKRGQETLAMFRADEDQQKSIAAWLGKGELDKLAQLWTQGLEVAWGHVYGAVKPKRISLPTYPFAKERYWVLKAVPDPVVGGEQVVPRAVQLERTRAAANKPGIGPATEGATGKPSGISLRTLETDLRNDVPTPASGNQYVPAMNHKTGRDATDSPAEETSNSRPASLKTLQEELTKTLAEVLYLEYTEIDAEYPFVELGLDSITGVEWAQLINQSFGLSLPVTRLYDYPTIRRLAEHLLPMVLSVPAGSLANHETSTDIMDSPVLETGSNRSESLKSLQEKLTKSLAEVLYLECAEIDTEYPFVELGLDSITGVEWAQLINQSFGLSLPVTRLYDYPTIRRLAEHLSPMVLSDPLLGASMLPGETHGLVAASAPRLSAAPRPVPAAPEIQPIPQQEGVAIVGMSGAFPKSKNLEEFWDNLVQGRDCVSEVPVQRWSIEQYYDPRPATLGRTYSKWMGALEEAECFDPLFFNISPAEAQWMDPQQRLFLEHSWNCIEAAGINPHTLSDSRCGVYVGCSASGYGRVGDGSELTAQGLLGSASSILSARIAYFLNLKGPCLALDTACSSSLVAIAEACDSLIFRQNDLVLAGGVCVLAGPDMHIMTSSAGMLSKVGRCFTFDARADGFVPAEGVGVLLLKRLTDAVRDQDLIHGVLRGWGVNQDGRTNGITAPSVSSQITLQKQVYERFGINPETISLVEAHGTGTALGDPIEVEALTASFRAYTAQQDYCALGSVKSNLGHLLAAAGVAGVIKVLLALRHRVLPPTINFSTLNERIAVAGSPFYINTDLQPWTVAGDQPRRAAVSSFGFSGTNAHLLLEEYPSSVPVRRVDHPQQVLLVLSAKAPERLQAYAAKMKAWAEGETELDLAALAYTLQTGREAMVHRLALVVESREQMLDALDRFTRGQSAPGFFTGQVKKSAEHAALFEDDEDADVLLQAWLRAKKLRKLAQLWVQGLAVEWGQLYGQTKPRRMSLPTYPFAKERYWGQTRVVPNGLERQLHPLLHRNTSDLSQQRFSTTLTGKEFFLHDHVVQGQRIVPGAAQLEWARAAVALASHGEVGQTVMLEEVMWLRPLVVAEPREVHIGLESQADGRVGFEIYSDSGDEAVVYSRGWAQWVAVGEAPQVDLEAVRAHCERTVAGEACYAQFAQQGLEFGPSFQVLKELWLGDQVAVGALRLTADAPAGYVWAPNMLDGALQASVGLAQNKTDAPLALPFAVAQVRQWGELPMPAWIVVRPSVDDSALVRKLELEIADGNGQVALRLSGFSTRPLPGAILVHEAIEQAVAAPQTVLLAPQWTAQAPVQAALSPIYERHGILLCEVGQDRPERIAELTAALPTAQCVGLTGNGTLAQRYTAYAMQLLAWLQKEVAAHPDKALLLQLIIPSEVEGLVLQGLGGLLRSAQQEYRLLACQVVAVEAEVSMLVLAQRLRAEAASPSPMVRYVNGQREVWDFAPLDNEETTLPWREQGVYLITGGLGGLGQVFARAIAQQVRHPVLVLTGRRALKLAQERVLEELQTMGARVAYRAADVSDAVAVAALVLEIVAQYGQLNGVIHSAGIVHDGLLAQKTGATLQQVLEPKVMGLIALDQATREVALDWLVLCSSVASVWGNVGQTDYAAANGFLDSYAQYRTSLVAQGKRQGRTVSVNWPLWAEGGMQLDLATQERLRRETGLEAMPSAAGVTALCQALAQSAAHVAVGYGAVARVLHQLQVACQARRLPTVTGSADNPVAIDELQLQIEHGLTGLISAQLKIAREELERDAALSEFGFDSITLTEFGNALHQKYGLTLSPTIFFEYATIAALAGYLAREHQAVLAPVFTATVATPIRPNGSALPQPFASTRSHWRGRLAAAPLRREASEYGPSRVEPIAVIGMSGCFPQAEDIDALWANLLAERNSIGSLPANRWDRGSAPAICHAGVIENIDQFDPLFFGISPREAQAMDPQQRLLMLSVYRVIEDAGYSVQGLSGSATALLVGAAAGSGYGNLLAQAGETVAGYSAAGLVGSMGPNRMSYWLNWHGPSEPIETACSSSLVAVHRALELLRSGQCAQAVVGGVNTLLSMDMHESFTQAGMLSPDGRCKTFSAQADGYVRGEGVGMLFLKPLAAAERDGDHIYGLLKGSATNHGGRANSLTSPNPRAQADLIKAALQQAGVEPGTVSYIEAHGTGTALGDPIEVQGLKSAFAELSSERPAQRCGLGSVKSNIGHLELAAGVAGLIKVLLQLQHRTLVKSLHCEELNPLLALDGSPFYVVQQTQAWEALRDRQGQELPRRAGVSSFGFGGVNAHVIVEEYVAPHRPAMVFSGPVVVVLSARNEAQLRQQVQQLLAYLERQAEVNLADLAYTLQVGREALGVRVAWVVSTVEVLKERLLRHAQGEPTGADTYQGELKHEQGILAVFRADEELQEVIGKWLARRKIGKLAELWVQGLVVAWEQLYGQTKPKRISLPTYPFAKERYWAPTTVQDQAVRGESVISAGVQLEDKPGILLSAESVTDKPSGIALQTLEVELLNEVPSLLSSAQCTRVANYGTADEITPLPVVEVARGLSGVSSSRCASPQILAAELTRSLAEVLYLEHADIDADHPFAELGLDSITGVEWVQAINKSFGLSLPVTRLYDYPTIRCLAEHLSSLGLSVQSAPMHQPTVGDITDRSMLLNPLAGGNSDNAKNPLLGTSMPPGESHDEVPTQTANVPMAPEHHYTVGADVVQPIPQQEGVAIVGMSGAFPKSKNLEEFWDNLVQGRDCVSEVPAQRWPIEGYYDPRPAILGRTYSKWMGVLEEAECFDPLFFNISPAEAQWMDPQQRLFLEHSWNCIEAAGINPQTLSNSRCGVYVGCGASDYGRVGDGSELTAHGLLGSASSILSARIAYFLNLKGPCLAIDTACSSSLVAIAEACDSLMLRQSDLVLAGGVYVSAGPDMHIMTGSAGMLSKVGRCFTFDARADGFVPGEGVGVLLLKRFTDAVRDQDLIHGVLRGWGVNQDGRTNGITAPSVSSQITLQKQVYERFGINPETISLIEAHGTGTALGDPIEVEALTESFRSYTAKQGYCALGSVKSNIGHLLTAAGVSGVIKVLLALRHRMLPPTINFSTLNERITVEGSPFYINTAPTPWTADEGQRRRAAVSSFGFSGTNAHLVLEDYPSSVDMRRAESPQQVLIVLSAKTAERLQAYAAKMKAWAEGKTELDLAALAYTLQTGREAMIHRLALVTESRAQMLDAFDRFTRGQSAPGLFTGQVKKSAEHAALFEEDEDDKALLQTWMRAKKLRKLAQLWVQGQSFDWTNLYPQSKPLRLSLPTYPFAKERYWVPAMRVQGGLVSQLHPLVHRNTSDFGEQRFSTTLTGEEFFLRDHVVRGERLAPGVAQLEWARAAVALANGGEIGTAGRSVLLQEVTWLRPLVITQPQEVHIGLEMQEDGCIGFEIYSGSGDDAVVYSQGWAQLAEMGEAPQVDLEAVLAQCEQQLTGEACYLRFAQLGLSYGPSFQVLGELRVGHHLAVGALRLAAEMPVGYAWVPNMLDGALQASVGLTLDKTDGSLALPFAVARVQQWGELPTPAWAVVQPGAGDSTAIRKFDVDIVDANGRVALRLSGFSARTLHEAAEHVVTAPQTVLRAPHWIAQTIAQPAAVPAYGVQGILLCEVGKEGPKRLAELAAALPTAQCVGLTGNGTLAQRYTTYAMQLLAWLQKEVAAHPNKALLLQLVVPSEGEDAVLQGLGGLLRSAQQEYRLLACQVVAVEAGVSMPVLAQRLRAEAASPSAMVRYVNGQREVWDFAPLEHEEMTLPWRDQGVYLITGGLGGLGQVFARAIAQQVRHPVLVLTGRRALRPAQERVLEELQTMGARVAYRAVDVSDAVAVAALVIEIVAQYGQLNGMIHSAGVVHDGLLAQKTGATLQQVLAPKVAGLVALDEATREVALDWLMLCSSAASVWGNVGQTDYAAANGFLDSYAQYRAGLVAQGQRQGRTVSVSWPLWAEGGMQLDPATQERLRRDTGLEAMPSAAGITALCQALAQSAAHVVVGYGVVARVLHYLQVACQARLLSPVAIEERVADDPAAVDELQSQIEHVLTGLISAQLKIAREELERDTSLSEFGFDSITLTEFGNALHQKYGLTLSPTIFFEYSTIAALAGYLVREYQAELAPAFTAMATTPIGPDSGTLSPTLAPVVPRRRQGHVAMATLKDDAKRSETIKAEPIAVIGMSGCFPQAEDINAFWANLLAQRDSIGSLPANRWDRGSAPAICHAGVIESIDEFDPLFFGISPREAQAMDPQQRLLMLSVYRVIEDAGYSVQSLSGSATALLVGTAGTGYGQLLAQAGETVAGYSAAGVVGSMGPNRMSYWLNWHGPSEPVETACSSSLVAVHRALELLRSGQCAQAVVGGVNTLLSLETHESFTQAGMLSPDGRCKTFSAQADGYVRGEGVGMLFLKPLAAAERDGDHIYGLLKGSATNHGGRANSLTAPNPRAQADLIKAALQQAGVAPETIGYIEAHGTGTDLGDPIEVQGLKSAFAELAPELLSGQSCGLGSVKSNIGHLELAAGVAGLIKVLLQMQHRTLIKSLHCEELNPLLALHGSPFYVVQQTQAWEALRDRQGQELPRRAGVSSFGFGGVNAHVIVEEYVAPQRVATVCSGPVVVVLSARTGEQLRQQIQQLLAYLERQPEVNLADLAYTLQVGREALGVRLALVVSTVDVLQERLLRYLRGEAVQEDTYEGELKHEQRILSVFRADEELQEAIGKWIVRRKIGKLAELWVQGLVVEWGQLYGPKKPQRISLPTYPFAKERYWVPQKVMLPNASEQHVLAETATLNPGPSAAGDLQSQIEHALTELISAQLKIARKELERDTPLSAFGFDSITLTEFSRVLNQKYGVSMTPAMFLKYTTVAKLAGYLARAQPAGLVPMFEVTAAMRTDAGTVSPPYLQHQEGNHTVAMPESHPTELEPIAVIGMSGCFPQANTLQEYWDNLVTGRDCITEIPTDRWSLDGFYIEDKQTALAQGCSYTKWGGFIPELNTVFNTEFFTTAFETHSICTDWTDEQKLFVQMVWTLLESAGYTSAELNKVCQSRVGVYAGMMSHPMGLTEANKLKMMAAHTMGGLSGMVSHLFKFYGPSLVIDTYSASSMTALHMACTSLAHGECEAAIAGGIMLMYPELYQYSCQLGILGSHPGSRSFAANSDGPLFCDGAGVVLLKRLSKAIQDKDTILGVIKSTVANNVGNIGLSSMPTPDVIANSIKENIVKSGIDPRTISYVETFAPGFAIADALEVFATEQAFREFTQDRQFCALGSLKPSIGHATAASGISQLIKVLLQMQHKQLAPTLQVSPMRSDLELEHSPFYLQQEAQAWDRPCIQVNGAEQEIPRRAMINSMGYGDFYAGVILEEYCREGTSDLREAPQIECPASEQLIVLSAKTAEHLKAMIEQLGQFVRSQAQFSLQDMAYTLQLGRQAMPLRWAVVVQDRASLLSALTFASKQQEVTSSVTPGRTIFAGTIDQSAKSGGVRREVQAQTPMLQHYLAKKDFAQIAACWVKGESIAWELLHEGQSPRRIELPTYPFLLEMQVHYQKNKQYLTATGDILKEAGDSDKEAGDADKEAGDADCPSSAAQLADDHAKFSDVS